MRRVAQFQWKVIEENCEKSFVASGLQFFPLPVICQHLSYSSFIYNFFFRIGFSFSVLWMQVMHGEDYVCLGFLFGEKYKVAYISDVSRFLPSTEQGECKNMNLQFKSCCKAQLTVSYGIHTEVVRFSKQQKTIWLGFLSVVHSWNFSFPKNGLHDFYQTMVSVVEMTDNWRKW